MQILTTIIAVVGSVISVIVFFDNIKHKSNTDIAKAQYEKGKLDSTLSSILQKLDKIEKKLDAYDKEIEERIEIAMKNHIAIYHSEKGNK